jgi:site-specific DNA-methyltransferase (adenine-specific)
MLLSTARHPPGSIRDAITDFFQMYGRSASVGDVLKHVRHAMGDEVAASSVRSYLRLNTPLLFERTGRGRYQLPNGAAEEQNKTRSARVSEPVFRFGSSALFNGDSIDWLAGQKPNSIHAVVTDPPYGLVEYTEKEQAKLRKGRGGVWRIPPSFDGQQRSPLPRFTTLSADDLTRLVVFFQTLASRLMPVLVPGAHLCIASNPLLSYLVSYAVAGAGFERRGEIIRLVMTMRGGDRPKNAHEEFPEVSVMPRSMWEPWLLFRKPLEGRVQDNLRTWKTGGLRRPSKEQPFFDVIESAPTHKSERNLANHPSLKPQKFLREVVRAMLPLGEGIVLDPFAGSGSTLAAAEAVGYASVGVEIDPAYVALAMKAIPPLARFRRVSSSPEKASCAETSQGQLYPE